MPSSVDSTLEELASRLRALKREAGHVFMLDALRRQFLGAAGEEAASAASPSATAASTRALPQRFPKTSLGKDSDPPADAPRTQWGVRDSLR